MADVQHGDLGYAENHVAHAFEYANASQREGATLAGDGSDVGKLAYQTDNDTLWMCTDDGAGTVAWAAAILSGEITVDTISEDTPNAGVTVDGTLIKDLVITSDLIGDVKSTDGTGVLDNGTDGTDAVFTGDVTGDVTGDLTGNVTGNLTGDVTGTADSADSTTSILETSSSVVMNMKVIDIGDWNMDVANNSVVAHGVTGTKIRDVSIIVRNDANTLYYKLEKPTTAGVMDGGVTSIDATNVNALRVFGGFFDGTDFNSTTYNRGWITIWYTD